MSFLAAVFVLTVLVTAQWSCNSYPTKSQPEEPATYQLKGCLAKDLSRDSAHVVIEFKREDTVLATAVIKYSGDSLALKNSLFTRAVAPAAHYGPGADTLMVKDSSRLNTRVVTSLPGNFTITSVVPDRREKLSFETVQVEWNTSTGSEGWAIAAVKKGQAYTGKGYSQWVGLQTNLATFDAEAFTLNNQTDAEIDTGLYYLYVYSIAGAPDRLLSASYLPTMLPSQLANNIDRNDLGGRFGAVVVARRDSMRVVAQ